MNLKYLLLAIAASLQLTITAQTYSDCNDFNNPQENFIIPLQSNWEIGVPNNTILDQAYFGNLAIVTDLDSNYHNNDTAEFIFHIENLVNLYLGHGYLTLEMVHKYDIAAGDYGQILVSVDSGAHWDPLIKDDSSFIGLVQHVNLSTLDTVFDSTHISGTSDGWIQSKFEINHGGLSWRYGDTTDVFMFKFQLISDGTDVGEGWQIDQLCADYEIWTHVEEVEKDTWLSIYPNPSKGSFTIDGHEIGLLSIFDVTGAMVLQTEDLSATQHLNLPQGMYVVTLENSTGVRQARLVVEP